MKKLMNVFLTMVFIISCEWGHALATPILDGAINVGEYTDVFNEDTPDSINYLRPGYGGQAYDAEFLGLFVTSDKLYFGLQTGIEIENATGNVATVGNKQPGDLTLNFNGDDSFEWAIRFWDEVFSIIKVKEWQEVHYPQHSVSNPWRAKSGGVNPNGCVDGSDFEIFFNSAAEDGYGDDKDSNILEGWISASALGLADFSSEIIEANWTMKCGNDYLNVTASVPEPATMFLISSGLIGMAAFRRKKNA